MPHVLRPINPGGRSGGTNRSATAGGLYLGAGLGGPAGSQRLHMSPNGDVVTNGHLGDFSPRHFHLSARSQAHAVEMPIGSDVEYLCMCVDIW